MVVFAGLSESTGRCGFAPPDSSVIPVLSVLISCTLLMYCAYRTERWLRHRALIRELNRILFDPTRLK
jgi:hypothetical protein